MTIGGAVMLGSITLAFVLFAITLMWGDFYSRKAKP
jgi:hypothetical protein